MSIRKLRSILVTLMLVPLGASAQNLLDGPCSASFDEANDRYLIASSQNQSIVAIDTAGNQTSFLENLGSYVFGVMISGDTVYVTDSNGSIRAYDLNTRLFLWGVYFTGAHYTGAMAIDNSGYMYITDNNGFDSKIYKLSLSDRTWETFVSSGLPGYTGHIVVDEPNNRLLVNGHYENTPILSLDLDDATLTPIVTPPTMNMGGIAMDSNRYVYISSYYGGQIYRYDQFFTNPPVLISEGYGSPCGISYNHIDNLLVVPSFEFNRIDFIPLDDGDDDGVIDINDNCPEAYNPEQQDADSNGVGDACCCGYYTGGFTGNANCSEDGNRTLSDITRLIDRVYISKTALCCELSGNTNGDSENLITLSDITCLIDNVYISRQETQVCAVGDPILHIPFGISAVVDGLLHSGEWSDAHSLTFSIEEVLNATVYVKHDGENLLAAFVYSFIGEEVDCPPEIFIDVNNDKSATWQPDDWWFHVSASDCEAQGTFDVYTNCAEDHPDWSAAPNATGLPLDTVEIEIPFSKIGVDVGSTIGVAFHGWLWPDEHGMWPSSAVSADPSTWGTAILEP